MIFLPIDVQFNGKLFSGSSEKLSFNPRFFLVKKAKICFFDEKWFWLKFYIRFKIKWQYTGLVDFINHQTLEILTKVDFYAFF